MAITQQQFDDLVARLEREADRNPQLYKLKLGAFATLGYVYIFGVLLLLLGAVGAIGAAIVAGKSAILIKLAIPVIVLVAIVVKSLWVKLDAPQGRRLAARDHPRLFAAIDEIRRATGAPPAHEVLLTNELNAAIVQVPRLGLFGWQKNYLILGLPLLQILSPEEFKGVLAHEFGHLSGAHGRFGAWIYRVRAGWARLNASLRQEEHWGRFLFVPFFDWYAPKFAAYSFVQARQQEYEADNLAAETVGAATVADALVRLNLKAEELDREYWPSVFKAADDKPSPEGSPFSGLLSAERRGFVPQAGEQLRQALQRRTDTADTHPCLGDRVAALGLRASVPTPFTTSAAEALFGDALGELVARFDREWLNGVADWWRGRHEHVQTSRQKLAALAARPRTELSDEELYEYALLVEELESVDAAFAIYRSLVLERGAQRGAKFAYARLLLARDDETGLALLEEVMRAMPETILPACDLIVGYLHAHGRQKDAQSYIDRFYERQASEQQARAVRETLLVKDTWLPQALSKESLRKLKNLLVKHRRDLKSVYLVRKKTPAGEPPLHVVGVVRRTPLFELRSAAANQEIIQRLATEIDINEEILFIWLNGEHRTFVKPFKKVPGSQLV